MNEQYAEVTLLLVEDDDIDAKSVARGLKKLKLANPLVRAKNGIEALDLLRLGKTINKPYIILLDLNMPRMGGLEFLREIRQDQELQSSIVFVLTTSQSDEDRAAAYSENIAGYIVKSDIKEGFEKVLKMLDHFWRVVYLPK